MCLKKRAQRYMRDLKTKTAGPECRTGWEIRAVRPTHVSVPSVWPGFGLL